MADGGGGSGGFAGGSGMDTNFGGGGAGGPGLPQDLYNEMFPGTVPGTGGYSQPGLSDQEIIAQMPGGEPEPMPEAPKLGDTTQAQDAAAAKQRRVRSRASTILTGANQAQGIGPGVGTISRRMLLGS
jgi:hypothetical protein